MLEQGILAERESLSSQNSFFEGMGNGGQIILPVSGYSRRSKTSQIRVARRFILVYEL